MKMKKVIFTIIFTTICFVFINNSQAKYIEEWITELKDKNPKIREEAASALERLKDSLSIDPLINVLKNKNNDVQLRGFAARALRNFRELRVIEVLLAEINDKDLTIQMCADQSLRAITGINFGKDRMKWQVWWEENKNTFEENQKKQVVSKALTDSPAKTISKDEFLRYKNALQGISGKVYLDLKYDSISTGEYLLDYFAKFFKC